MLTLSCRYCSRSCQKKDWVKRGHKKACAELQKDAATADSQSAADASVTSKKVDPWVCADLATDPRVCCRCKGQVRGSYALEDSSVQNWWLTPAALYSVCPKCVAVTCWKCVSSIKTGSKCRKCSATVGSDAEQYAGLASLLNTYAEPPNMPPHVKHIMVVVGIVMTASWGDVLHRMDDKAKDVGLTLLKQAHNLGSIVASEILGEIYLSTSWYFSLGDWATAEKFLLSAAHNGSAWGYNKMGVVNEKHKDDLQTALQFYALAHDFGDPEGRCQIARCLVVCGDAQCRDFGEAERLAKEGEKKGVGLAHYVLAELAILYCEDGAVKRARKHIQDGVKLKNPQCIQAQLDDITAELSDAQSVLSLFQKQKRPPLEMLHEANVLLGQHSPDFLAAKTLAVAAAKAGVIAANTWLGIMYSGVQDVQTPVDWADYLDDAAALPPINRVITNEERRHFDRNTALRYLTRAADEGQRVAKLVLTSHFGVSYVGLEMIKESSTAPSLDAKGMLTIAGCFQIRGDRASALLWLEKASASKWAPATWSLALGHRQRGPFRDSMPVPDEPEFLRLRDLAIAHGSKHAIVSKAMESLDHGREHEALSFFKEAGLSVAPDALAAEADRIASASGIADDVVRDGHMAIGLRVYAADNGSAAAAYTLARSYSGEDVGDATDGIASINPAESERLYRQAAEAGDGRAQVALGILLTQSDPESTEAFGLFKLAAEKGIDDAFYEVGEGYLHGEATEQDEAEAVRWFLRGAETEHGRCLWRLAAMHEYGSKTVTRSRLKAIDFLERAIKTKNSPHANLGRARECLEKLKDLEQEVQEAERQAQVAQAITRDWFAVHNKPVPDDAGPDVPVDQRFINLTSLCTIDRAKELRFKEGDVVLANIGQWKFARVIGLWDDGNPYRLLIGGDRGANVWALEDTDQFVKPVEPLRFKVGDKVSASLSSWRHAIVTQLWGSDDSGIYPYELKVVDNGPEQGQHVWAAQDTDDYVRERRRGKGKK